MPTVRIQEKNYSESIMVLKLKDGYGCQISYPRSSLCPFRFYPISSIIKIPYFFIFLKNNKKILIFFKKRLAKQKIL